MLQLRNKHSGEFLVCSGNWGTCVECRYRVTGLLWRGKEDAVVQGMAWRQLSLQPASSTEHAAGTTGVFSRAVLVHGNWAYSPQRGDWPLERCSNSTGSQSWKQGWHRWFVLSLECLWLVGMFVGGWAVGMGLLVGFRNMLWALGFCVWGINVGLLCGTQSLLAVGL